MSKKNKENVKEEAIALDETLTKSEAFIEKNLKTLLIALAAIAVIVIGFFLWNNHKKGVEKEAQNAIYKSQALFAQQQFESALNGDGQGNIGFLKVIDQYSGTKTANLAKLYAGLCYSQIGKTDDAIKMIESFDTKDDQMISPAALGALGNFYIEKGQNEKGIETLLSAAKKANNNTLSPLYLMQAAQVYESLNQNDKAVELYKQIKDNYKNSQLYQDIDKYIERATTK